MRRGGRIIALVIDLCQDLCRVGFFVRDYVSPALGRETAAAADERAPSPNGVSPASSWVRPEDVNQACTLLDCKHQSASDQHEHEEDHRGVNFN